MFEFIFADSEYDDVCPSSNSSSRPDHHHPAAAVTVGNSASSSAELYAFSSAQPRPASHRGNTHTFNGPLSVTTWVSQYQKGKTNLDFTETRDSEWQWHQLGHMQVCTSFQTDNHTSTPPLSFCRPYALPAAQPTASKH